MTIKGFIKFLGLTQTILPKSLSDAEINVYLDVLDPVPDVLVPDLATQVLRTWKVFPKPAGVWDAYEALRKAAAAAAPVGIVETEEEDPLEGISDEEFKRGKARKNVLWRLLAKGPEGIAQARAMTRGEREAAVDRELERLGWA